MDASSFDRLQSIGNSVLNQAGLRPTQTSVDTQAAD
jgi:hypothetical protein